ncbi:MAG: undecaprenyl/decaprenyl-phosphate alpha-N-acetylglucosaminyl 1-phosphate transferase [Verrucomicrobia bacterium]|nr:undecaprenyl/decaprenyl-phosphate alpha-N-acetylglucosaminyl 1-phosphate transferase [Verrucomicrobiota bacterium]
MNFPAAVYFAAFVVALLTALAALPFWRRWCFKTNLVDDPGHRKIHHTPIPLAGGLAVFTGMIAPIILGIIALKFSVLSPELNDALIYGFGKRQLQLGGILFGAVGMLLIGFADDKWELKPALKFSAQLAVAALVAACGVRITLFVPNVVFSYFVTILWILTVINAFNFMDNMNGLCSGLGAIAASQFGLIAALNGQYLVALLSFTIAGALLGFLPFNFPKASAFLGDAGSHLVGFLMAISAILPHFYSSQNPRPWAVLSPLLILAVPLGDLISVVLLRWRMGKPFYIGDTNHLSHRLVRNGMTQRNAVLLIWLLAVIVGALAFL